jgi:chromosome segregation protein
LDNTNNFFSSSGGDFDEAIIERVVSRDGTNEYLLNGSQVRLRDIVELLSRAHIGASGHHIISQGEADRILSASIKERREMIEDALGLKIYQYKREESERKLLKTEENVKQVESLRKEIAPHIKFLKKQVEKVEKAEELKNKLVVFYRQYLKREKIYIENEKEKIKEQKRPLETELKRLEKEMENAKETLNSSAKKDSKSQDLLEVEGRIQKMRNEKDVLSREVGKIEGEIMVTERNIEKINLDHSREESKTVPLKDLENLEREISILTEISQILTKIRDFISKHKETRDERDLKELLNATEKLQNKKSDAEKKIGETEQKLRELDQEYLDIKNSIEKEKDSERDAEKAIFKIAGEQSELRGKMSILESEHQRLNLVEEDWKREIQEGGILLGTLIVGFENDEIISPQESFPSESPRVSLLSQARLSSENFLAGPEAEPRARQEERRRELEKMKIRLEELGGAGGAEVMKEYTETVERDEFLTKELDDLKRSADSLQNLIKELLEKLDVEFKQGIEKINESFQKFFSIMFGGGEAKLEVVKEKIKKRKSDDLGEDYGLVPRSPDEYLDEVGETKEGIEISVSLPRKRVKSLEMLSGGERALTSIALLFAISQVNPPPFIILDETDAALDEANSKKYGDMIESLSKYSQLILITHNRETMSRAGVIYGVTMDRSGVSRILSIAFDEAVAVAK